MSASGQGRPPVPESPWIEFFITCNPPMLPAGVERVINHMRSELPATILDIVYDPEGPWFKCNSRSHNQDDITENIEGFLENILEEGTFFIDLDQVDEARNTEQITPQADIDTSPSEGQLIPWSFYTQDVRESDETDYDNCWFPSIMQDLKYKVIWRGLEMDSKWTIKDFLEKAYTLGGESFVPEGRSLSSWMDCDIFYDLHGDLLYIGSSSSTTEKAVRTLQTLLDVLSKDPARSPRHMVMTDHWPLKQVCFRWLSHLGLSHSTYLPAAYGSVSRDYQQLMRGATLRGQGENEKERPALKPIPSSKTQFEPFDGYQFTSKQPRKFKPAGARGSPSTGQRLPTRPTRPSPGPESISLAQEAQTTQQVPKVLTQVSANGVFPPAGPAASSNPDVRRAELSRPVSANRPSLPVDSEDLISFENDPGALNLETRENSPNRESQPTAEYLFQDEFDNLASYSVIRPVSVTRRDENQQAASLSLLDLDLSNDDSLPQPHANGRRESGNPSLQFGIQDDSPVFLHRTMNQGAGKGNAYRAVTKNPKSPATKGSIASSQQEHREPKSPVASTSRAPNQTDLMARPADQTPSKSSQSKPARKKSDDLVKAELEARASAHILQVAGGHVSLQLRFGRIWFKNLQESAVSVGHAPSWALEDMLAMLNNDTFKPDRTNFSPILTTAGADANTLVGLAVPGAVVWERFETTTWYEFTCLQEAMPEEEKPQLCFTVCVNARDFSYHCRGLLKEVSASYLHCVNRTWDMKICGMQQDNVDDPECLGFAGALVTGLGICADDKGDIEVTVANDGIYQGTILDLRIRHSATYRNLAEGHSLLTVDMYRMVQRGRAYKAKTAYLGYTTPAEFDEPGCPGRWFEASISSSAGQKILAQNVDLEFGDRAQWHLDQLEAAGVFEDLCRPALVMISRMDHIGSANDNGQGVNPHHNPSSFSLPNKKEVPNVFW